MQRDDGLYRNFAGHNLKKPIGAHQDPKYESSSHLSVGNLIGIAVRHCLRTVRRSMRFSYLGPWKMASTKMPGV
jgi:hypothetical protein